MSWWVRTYIAIIQWNSPKWIDLIFDHFQLIDHSISIGHRRRELCLQKIEIEKSEENPKKRAIYRNSAKKQWALNSKAKNLHYYKGEFPKSNFLKLQKWIVECIASLSTEDKPCISMTKIMNYITTSKLIEKRKSSYKLPITIQIISK